MKIKKIYAKSLSYNRFPIFGAAVLPLIFIMASFNGSIDSQFNNALIDRSELNGTYSSDQIDDSQIHDSYELGVITDLKQIKIQSPDYFVKTDQGLISNLEISECNKLTDNSDLTSLDAEDSKGKARGARISGIDIALSSIIDFTGVIEELGGYGASQVGEKSTFTFWFENLGDTSASNVQISMTIRDWFKREVHSEYKPPVSIAAQQNISLSFDWTPLYSNYYNIIVNVSAVNDVNQSNNQRDWWVNALSWSEDFESGDLSGWTGNKAENSKWHITDSIKNDPNSTAHSSPNALYHGEEIGDDQYGINEDYYLTLPPFDLRRFVADSPGTYLMYQFYGSSSPGDKLTLEIKQDPNKDFELSSILPTLSGDTKNGASNEFEWQGWKSESAPFPGIPISIFTGEIVQFRLHWQSDTQPESKTGFYLDDFILFGLETPPSEKDIGLDDLTVDSEENPWNMPVLGKNIDVSVKVKNYGRSALNNVQVNFSVHDEQGREVTKIATSTQTIPSMSVGAEEILTWKFMPEISGNFYLSVRSLLNGDGWSKNDVINKTITVAKFYYNTENADESWTAETGWYRTKVPNDPDYFGHSQSHAWYFGNSNFTYDPNMDTSLYSPMIDMQGINPSNTDIKIFVNFKFYGYISNNDVLLFEYALDGSDDWNLVNDGGSLGDKYSTTLSGNYQGKWYDMNEIKNIQVGSTQFIGHSVQFRWHFVSDHVNENLIGYFVDDLIVWSIEEDYGRPSVVSAGISTSVLENQGADSALITVMVNDLDNNLPPGGITIDLRPLNGDSQALLYDDGTHGDVNASDGILSLTVTGSTSIQPGNTVLTVKSVDTDGKVGLGFIKLKIIKNKNPDIFEVIPGDAEIIMYENESKTFSIKASDPGDIISYQWYLNNELIKENTNKTSFDFNSTFDGTLSNGTYKLNVSVFDDAEPPGISYREWEISVLDILPDFFIKQDSITISNPNPRKGDTVYFNLTFGNLGLKPELNVDISMIEVFISDSGDIEDKFDLLDNKVIDKIDGSFQSTASFKWIAVGGQHEFEFKIDPDDKVFELNENNNVENITVLVAVPVDVETPEPVSEDGLLSNLFGNIYLTAVVVIIILFSTFGLAVGGTELGRYRFFSMLIPLYSRLKGTKILSHSLREQIYNHIKRYPGDHYRSIMNKLELKNGTLVHHLNRLEQEELIKSEKDGLYRRFYPMGMRIPKSNVGMYYPDGTVTYNIGERQVSETQMNILKTLAENPGITQKQIAETINESRRVVNYHIKLLSQSKLIKVVHEGRETRCYLQVDLT